MKRVSKRQAALNRAVASIKDAKCDRCVICGRPYVDAAASAAKVDVSGILHGGVEHCADVPGASYEVRQQQGIQAGLHRVI